MNRIKPLVLAFAALGLLLTGAGSALAHDVEEGPYEINGTGMDVAVSFQHRDAQPYKGSINVDVTNTGTVAWDDFHFEIFAVPGSPIGAGDVLFKDTAAGGEDPTSSQAGLTWTINTNDAGFSIIDLFFTEVVGPNDTAWFKVYTDNTTASYSVFGTLVYPTPVPLPGAAWLFGSALLGLLGMTRKVVR